MSEEKIPGIMREFVKVLAAREVENALAYFTDDAVWVDPYGTYKGKDAIKRHIGVMTRNLNDMKIVEAG